MSRFKIGDRVRCVGKPLLGVGTLIILPATVRWDAHAVPEFPRGAVMIGFHAPSNLRPESYTHRSAKPRSMDLYVVEPEPPPKPRVRKRRKVAA